jgi:hypothetical protein
MQVRYIYPAEALDVLRAEYSANSSRIESSRIESSRIKSTCLQQTLRYTLGSCEPSLLSYSNPGKKTGYSAAIHGSSTTKSGRSTARLKAEPRYTCTAPRDASWEPDSGVRSQKSGYAAIQIRTLPSMQPSLPHGWSGPWPCAPPAGTLTRTQAGLSLPKPMACPAS